MPQRSNDIRLGADIGGTFTDIVLDVRGTLFSTKVLTTYAAPEQAILDGVAIVARDAGIAPGEIGMVIHGTTLATNALIERRGAKTALVTTQGFRDVIEMRTESRFEQYDLDISLPPPLVPRDHRFTVAGRIAADGRELQPLDEAGLHALAERIAAEEFGAVAVGFIHAYMNADHERRARDILARRLSVPISISAEVSPQMREYERFNTVCANAYVQPLMASYLARLQTRLKDMGVGCPVFMIHSGGGLISVETAAAFPVRLVESGPAGGAIFAADIARRFDLDSVVSYDMGGTTAKICLIDDFAPQTARTFEVARTWRFSKGSGMPISIPVIEMIEIGAGGGSIAWVDALGRIQTGPESAGSEPGPACYGRGGERPAITDADLVLGKIDPLNFAGGAIALDAAAARAAILRDVGGRLGLDPLSAAFGIGEVVDENMANAARVHAVENGKTISDSVMIAFGGAAPLHAARLCEKLGLERCLVPQGAGVGSAIGFLKAPFGYEAVTSHLMRLSRFDPAEANALLADLRGLAGRFVREGTAGPVSFATTAFMRYAGQGWEIPVPLAEAAFGEDAGQRLATAFREAYARFFGRAIDALKDLEIEVVTWSVKASDERTVPARHRLVEQGRAVAAPLARDVFDPVDERMVTAAIVERSGLQAGDRVTGPAVIVERETSTVVTARFDAVIQTDGSILLVRKETRPDLSSRSQQTAVSDVRMQVMWNRLIAVVEEQAKTLLRTAFSTSVREAGDLSAGVFDPQGRMLAQAVTGTPGHVNTMAAAVRNFMDEIPRAEMFEGDTYVTNDPWLGTCHLHDITMVSPSFFDGELVGFFACTAHVVDVGGRGFGADAKSVYEEGIQIPIMKFAERGVVNRDLVRMIHRNVREPNQVVGDFYSLAACNDVGHRRLVDMMRESGIQTLDALADFIFSRTQAAMRERIAALPRGSWSNALATDGYDEPVHLRAAVTIGPESIHVDFAGSAPVSRYGINVPVIYTKAYASYALKCVVAPDIPNNAASLAFFTVSAPPCILAAERPAPVALRHVIGHMVPDLVLGALAQALPGRVLAEGAGALWNIHISVRPVPGGAGRRAEVLMFNSGGMGARPGLDGLSATAFPSGVQTMPIEATEHTGPIVIWRKELRPGSGGDGRYRGGLGQVMEIAPDEGHEFDFSAMFDRVRHAPRGRDGGRDGVAGAVRLDDGTPMRPKGWQHVPAGRRLVLELPGGGGYGDPDTRTTEARALDRRRGYVDDGQD